MAFAAGNGGRGGRDRGNMNRRGMMKSLGGPPLDFMPPDIKALFVSRPPLEILGAVPPTDAQPAPAAAAEGAVSDPVADEALLAPGEEGGAPVAAAAPAPPAAPAEPEAPAGPSPPHSALSGVASLLGEFETGPPPPPRPPLLPLQERREAARAARVAAAAAALERATAAWDPKSDPAITGNALATLFVGRLPKGVTERRLANEFKEYGEIRDLRLVKDKAGKSRGYAFIEFEEEGDVKVSSALFPFAHPPTLPPIFAPPPPPHPPLLPPRPHTRARAPRHRPRTGAPTGSASTTCASSWTWSGGARCGASSRDGWAEGWAARRARRGRRKNCTARLQWWTKCTHQWGSTT